MSAQDQSPVITGSCRCGALKYHTTGPPISDKCNYCHCFTCRRTSGSAFLPFADFDVSAVLFSSGSTTAPMLEAIDVIDALKTYRASSYAQRFFCGNCGSQLGMRYDAEPKYVGLTLGTVDEKTLGKIEGGLKIKRHIYVGEKAGWFELPDDGAARESTMREEEALLGGEGEK